MNWNDEWHPKWWMWFIVGIAFGLIAAAGGWVIGNLAYEFAKIFR